MKVSKATMQLSSRGSRAHFAVAIALTSVIPSLTLFYLYSSSSGVQPLTAAQWMVAALGVGGAIAFGYVLLGRYPATIVRLRACLQRVLEGELPDAVDLAANESDIMAVEQALNVVLHKLRQKLDLVSAQKSRLEDELFQAHKLEAIGTLAAGIAHEINTPLQFVSNNVQFLEKACDDLMNERAGVSDREPGNAGGGRTGAAPDGQREFLRAELPRAFKQLQQGIARVSEIVKAIQEFARGNSGDEKALVDLNKMIQTTVEVTRNEWKYDADLITDLAPALPLVSCSPGEIKRTLMNLILNAVQAIADREGTRRGTKGSLCITTRSNGQEVALSVSDNGCGIAPGIRNRVFDPFFTTREIGAGKGCGLAFAHAAVVTRHGGTLTFVTEENEGSTFTVTLPLKAGGG